MMKSSLVIILLMLFHIVGWVVSDPKTMYFPTSPPPYHTNESQSQSSPSHELSHNNLTAANLDYTTNNPPQPAPYQFLKLSQIWPESYCIMKNQVCRQITPSKFVIHGLWPSNNGSATSQPRNCDNTTQPNFSSFSFRRDLQKQWPSLRSYESTAVEDTNLWLLQWNYHGTCSLTTPERYFQVTLILQRRINLKFTLINAGLPPNNRRPYQLSIIFDAIKNRIGFKPQIQCYQHLLLEIRLCLDKTIPHNYIDCPRDYVDCPTNAVYLPEQQ